MKYDYGFRIDVGQNVGSGHFFRCLSIAQELKKLNKEVIFLINDEIEFVRHLGDYEFPYLEFTSSDESNRISSCKEELKNIKNLIIDLPFENEAYSKNFHDICNTFVIDDLGNKEIFSHGVFNSSIVTEFHTYDIKSKFTKTFTGPKYFILRDEIKKERENVKLSRDSIKKILLTFGGFDSAGLSMKILPIFKELDFDVTIVIGHSNQNGEKIEELCNDNNCMKVNYSQKDFTKLLSSHDLVISSSGLVSYELAFLGLPSIFIASETWENSTASYLEKNGFGVNYGFWNNKPELLKKEIFKLDDFKERELMYKSGRNIIDGMGLDRVTRKIIELSEN